MSTLVAAPRLARPWVLWAIAAAWALAVAAEVTGARERLHHDALLGAEAGLAGSLAFFVVVWQVHVVAMMLPSSLPLIRRFVRVSAHQARPVSARAAFLAGYTLVWTGFGALALLLDSLVHRTIEHAPALAARPGILAGAVLLLAGLFQFSDFKDSCLRQCRTPGQFLARHYRRGTRAAFDIGVRHGLFCLGCCWALMLLLFALGVANLALMAPLALLMVLEKTARWGGRLVVPVGAFLITAGALSVASGLAPGA